MNNNYIAEATIINYCNKYCNILCNFLLPTPAHLHARHIRGEQSSIAHCLALSQ